MNIQVIGGRFMNIHVCAWCPAVVVSPGYEGTDSEVLESRLRDEGWESHESGGFLCPACVEDLRASVAKATEESRRRRTVANTPSFEEITRLREVVEAAIEMQSMCPADSDETREFAAANEAFDEALKAWVESTKKGTKT